MPEEITAKAEEAMGNKVFPGCVIGVIRKDGTRTVMPFGHFTYEKDSPGVREDTMYDLASVTKSIPIASLALTLIAEGKLRLKDEVVEYLPELQHAHGATIEDLLTYRVQGVRLSTLRHATFEEIRTQVFERGFDAPPGEANYTNVPAFLLGLILERAGGAILPALADKYFFGPLEMKDTTFFPHDTLRIPPTEIVGDTEVRGIVHDESARIFSRARRAVGHAGLFSTASDILNFLGTLLRGGLPAVLDGAQKGLGWQLNEGYFMGAHTGARVFGKTGFTGTSVVVDPHQGIAFVILSNRTYPKRPADAVSPACAINVFRSDVSDIVLGSAV